MVGLATILATGKNMQTMDFLKMERILLKMMLWIAGKQANIHVQTCTNINN